MTWEIALGIFALSAFVLSIVAMVSKVTSAVSRLTESVDNLNKTIDEMRQRSRETHTELYRIVNDHETRITILEKGEDK